MSAKQPVLLSILDGWGYSPVTEGNAVYHAHKPVFDRLFANNPNVLIEASGPWVGLPKGQMGNSEVGHLNIGSGRMIRMDVSRIDVMIEQGTLDQDPSLLASMAHGAKHRLHIMGLVSDGGVHSMNTHLYALLRMAKKVGVGHVFVHVFTDGRDTPPHSGLPFVTELLKVMKETGGKIASLSGRYYAMDRDKRWERVEKAFNAMVLGTGRKATSALDAMETSYAEGKTDEFIEPFTMVDSTGQPIGRIEDNDACLFFNYRADRGRELSMALTDTELPQPPRALAPKNLHFTTMTEYDRSFPHAAVLKRESHKNIMGEVVSAAGLTNLRVAETEKYPHVTYFFNGGAEKPFDGEDREMVQSPKVATYDLMPEMSAAGVTDIVVKALESKKYDLIVVNFANPDMVGHSGVFEAAKKAVETVDTCLARLEKAFLERGGTWLITADHGNSETMIDPITKGPHTYHTTNPVPFIVVNQDPKPLRTDGALRDIAPTILGLLGVSKPEEMTGVSLITCG